MIESDLFDQVPLEIRHCLPGPSYAVGRDFGFRRSCRYSVTPMIQGLNSSSPTPASSLFVGFPDATARSSSKTSSPTCSTVAPSRMRPASTSMSGACAAYRSELLAILSDGAGLNPKQEPRPVVKATMLHP